MNRSQLKQLIREVIQEMNIPDWNIENDNYSYNGKSYAFYAKVSHSYGEKDVEVEDLEVYDIDDPVNRDDSVKEETDPKVLKFFEQVAKEEYIWRQYDNRTFDDSGKDQEAIQSYKDDMAYDAHRERDF
jgi:hypothetical protein